MLLWGHRQKLSPSLTAWNNTCLPCFGGCWSLVFLLFFFLGVRCHNAFDLIDAVFNELESAEEPKGIACWLPLLRLWARNWLTSFQRGLLNGIDRRWGLNLDVMAAQFVGLVFCNYKEHVLICVWLTHLSNLAPFYLSIDFLKYGGVLCWIDFNIKLVQVADWCSSQTFACHTFGIACKRCWRVHKISCFILLISMICWIGVWWRQNRRFTVKELKGDLGFCGQINENYLFYKLCDILSRPSATSPMLILRLSWGFLNLRTNSFGLLSI